ncbi:MAG: hypothetical protein IPM63_02650 [Acidobacteriota bacterium]|nr:MAG: hypothetical protein IPM63_02650 [Acidobacteriota bacterium]
MQKFDFDRIRKITVYGFRRNRFGLLSFFGAAGGFLMIFGLVLVSAVSATAQDKLLDERLKKDFSELKPIRDYKELEGLWKVTGIGCYGRESVAQIVRIEVREREMVATKVTGDDCLGPGTVHFTVKLPEAGKEFKRELADFRWQVQDPPETPNRRPFWVTDTKPMKLFTDYIFDGSYTGRHYERISEEEAAEYGSDH